MYYYKTEEVGGMEGEEERMEGGRKVVLKEYLNNFRSDVIIYEYKEKSVFLDSKL